MNVVIFSLTILAIYGIINFSYKLWKRADIKEKKREIDDIYIQEAEIRTFKKAHKGNRKQQRKNIKNFNKE